MLFLWLCWCIDQLVSSYIILNIYTIRNAINVDGANRFHDHCTGLHSLGAKRLSPTASWSFRVGGFLWQIERILWDQWGYYIIYMFFSLKWEFHSCSGPLLFVKCVYWEAFRCFFQCTSIIWDTWIWFSSLLFLSFDHWILIWSKGSFHIESDFFSVVKAHGL